MKAYVLTTGAVFGMIVLAHIWRVALEGPQLAKDPFYILITLVAAGLCLWAWRVVRSLPRT
jgi:hypothetical protein